MRAVVCRVWTSFSKIYRYIFIPGVWVLRNCQTCRCDLRSAHGASRKLGKYGLSMLRFCRTLRTLRLFFDYEPFARSQLSLAYKSPSAHFGTVGHHLFEFRPSPTAGASCLADPAHSPDHDFAVALACACDGDFEGAFSSDCVGASSMAFTSRKW